MSKYHTANTIRTGLKAWCIEVKTSYTTDIRYFERQEIQIPVFDTLSGKYEYDSAHVERSFSV